MITTLNLNTFSSDNTVPAIWIGHPGPLSSPYHKGQDGALVAKNKHYRAWLWGKITEGGPALKLLLQIARLSETQDIALLYNDYSQSDVAEEIKKAAEWLASRL